MSEKEAIAHRERSQKPTMNQLQVNEKLRSISLLHGNHLLGEVGISAAASRGGSLIWRHEEEQNQHEVHRQLGAWSRTHQVRVRGINGFLFSVACPADALGSYAARDKRSWEEIYS